MLMWATNNPMFFSRFVQYFDEADDGASATLSVQQ